MTDLHNDELQETRFAASSSANTDDSASVGATRQTTVLCQGPCQSFRNFFQTWNYMYIAVTRLSCKDISGNIPFLTIDAHASENK